MKKILMLCVALIMLMGDVCSAAPVRVLDGTLDEFLTLYGQTAQEIHSNMKIDIKLYQHPFKNAVASSDDYTAYTCKVGNNDKLSPYITLFLNKSDYVSQIIVTGYVINKDGEPYCEKSFAASAIACIAKLGLENSDYWYYVKEGLQSALQKETNEYRAWSKTKHRAIHIDTKRIATVGKNKQYQVHIYATTD